MRHEVIARNPNQGTAPFDKQRLSHRHLDSLLDLLATPMRNAE